jgi:hypothetical protein
MDPVTGNTSDDLSDGAPDELELELEEDFEDEATYDLQMSSQKYDTEPLNSVISSGYHTCSSCRNIRLASKQVSSKYIWGEFETITSAARDDCAFFRFCCAQMPHFSNSATLFISIELNSAQTLNGARVRFTRSRSNEIREESTTIAAFVRDSK